MPLPATADFADEDLFPDMRPRWHSELVSEDEEEEPYTGRLENINPYRNIKRLTKHPATEFEVWNAMIRHDSQCKCDKRLRPFRHDHTLLAPQILVLNKATNAELTKFYFRRGRFAAKIEFSGRGEALRPIERDHEGEDEYERFRRLKLSDEGTPWRNAADEREWQMRLQRVPLDPVLQWHQVEIVPGQKYPLSFDSVRYLELHIKLSPKNINHTEQYIKGLQNLARIFAPGQAPAELRTLTLRFILERGVYDRLRGYRGDHEHPRNIPPIIKRMIQSFYVFSGEGNGTVKSIREEGELDRQGIDPNMNARYQLALRKPNTEIRKTVEVDFFVSPEDGRGEDLDLDDLEDLEETWAA